MKNASSPHDQVVFGFTLRKPDVAEKYFWLAALTFASAAAGFIISRPWTGVKATLLAIPLTILRVLASLPLMLVAPPHTACCFCMFFFRVWLILTFVLSSTCAALTWPPIPPLPMLPLV